MCASRTPRSARAGQQNSANPFKQQYVGVMQAARTFAEIRLHAVLGTALDGTVADSLRLASL